MYEIFVNFEKLDRKLKISGQESVKTTYSTDFFVLYVKTIGQQKEICMTQIFFCVWSILLFFGLI